MPTLRQIVPDVDVLLALTPEELGAALLEYFNALPVNEQRFNPATLARDVIREYGSQRDTDVGRAVMEGWSWLIREGLIIRKPEDDYNWHILSRRGARSERGLT